MHKHTQLILLMLLIGLVVYSHADAQFLKSSVVANGGAILSGGNITLAGTVGQPVVGVVSNNTHTILSGFWYVASEKEQDGVDGCVDAGCRGAATRR